MACAVGEGWAWSGARTAACGRVRRGGVGCGELQVVTAKERVQAQTNAGRGVALGKREAVCSRDGVQRLHLRIEPARIRLSTLAPLT